MHFPATGAANDPPKPAFSTSTAIAMRGLSNGANPTYHAWSFPWGFCAVPVFPAASIPWIRAMPPVPPGSCTTRRIPSRTISHERGEIFNIRVWNRTVSMLLC